MDDAPSALPPRSALLAIAEAFEGAGRDYARPFSWMYPWVLALAGIAATLLLSS